MTDVSQLAAYGGPPSVTVDQAPLLRWPQLGLEEAEAVLRVMREGQLSITNRSGVIAELEDAFAAYDGTAFALARCNGTAALHSAYFAVVEDASHAHGSLYKGRKTGALGDVGCFSLQASKSMTAGEGGILVTNHCAYYERALVLAQSPGRLHQELSDPDLRRFADTELGLKYRMPGLSAALALTQLRKLDALNAIRVANHDRLTERLRDLPGITPPYTAPDCYRGACYEYCLLYDPQVCGGLPTADLVERLRAEGVWASPKRYPLQHLQPLYADDVLFEQGLPWGIRLPRRRIHNRPGDPPVTEDLHRRLIALPAFPHHGSEPLIDQYAEGIRKVVEASLA